MEGVDFAASGLLDGLQGEARAQRERLLERLSAAGVPLEELRERAAGDQLVFAAADRLVGGGREYTLREISAATRLEMAFLREARRASGLAVPADDDRVLSSGDLALMRLAASYRALGLSDDDLFEVARVLARGLAPVAETLRRIALRLAMRPGAGEEEVAAGFTEVVAELGPLLEPLLGESMRLRLRDIARTEAVTAAELSAGVLPGARTVGVCFADLVGFTSAGEQLDPDELGQIAGRLEHLADRAIQPPVRIVKTLGDAVMLVSTELAPLLGSALGLVQAAEEDERLPQLRAGVAYGPALSRAADWYGRPVNLASRLTDVARPGSVLAHELVREALGEGRFSWSLAGPRRLKGISEPVRMYRVRHETAVG